MNKALDDDEFNLRVKEYYACLQDEIKEGLLRKKISIELALLSLNLNLVNDFQKVIYELPKTTGEEAKTFKRIRSNLKRKNSAIHISRQKYVFLKKQII